MVACRSLRTVRRAPSPIWRCRRQPSCSPPHLSSPRSPLVSKVEQRPIITRHSRHAGLKKSLVTQQSNPRSSFITFCDAEAESDDPREATTRARSRSRQRSGKWERTLPVLVPYADSSFLVDLLLLLTFITRFNHSTQVRGDLLLPEISYSKTNSSLS
jgi:hypothetical protein